MSIRTCVVNLVPSDGIPAVRLNQYDVGVTLIFTVMDGDNPAVFEDGTSVTLQGTRPSGTGYSLPASLDSNFVTIDSTLEMSREYGDSICELRFVKDGEDLGTGNFKIGVEKAAFANDTIDENTNHWNQLAQQVHADTVSAVNAALAAGNSQIQAAQSATDAGESAEQAFLFAKSSKVSADQAKDYELEAEAWTRGTREGVPVGNNDKTHKNNAKWYAEQAGADKAAADASAEAAAQSAIEAAESVIGAVKYTPQELSEEQQLQAKANINAADATTVAEAIERANTWMNAGTQGQILGRGRDGIEWIDNPPVDVTLTVSGRPADAKAVGTNLQTIRADVVTNTDDLETVKDQMVDVNTKLPQCFANAIVDDNILRLYNTDGEEVLSVELPAGGGGGGGGGESVDAKLTVQNVTGWLSTTIADGDDCVVSLDWSSIEDGMPTGPGTIRIMDANGHIYEMTPVDQGVVERNLKNYLTPGRNSMRVTIFDAYGQGRTINFTINNVAISVTSTFDPTVPYTGSIVFPYTPEGAARKDVHFFMDGEEVGTVTTSASGREQTFLFAEQSHGTHVIECWFESEINGQIVKSNTLHYEIICLEEGNEDPIIVSRLNEDTFPQYTTINLDYQVYNPTSMYTDVDIYVNNVLVSEGTVDRTGQVFSYRPDVAGEIIVRLEAGSASREFVWTITESDIHVEPATDSLTLYLSSQGRDNSQANRNEWKYGNIESQLTGFTFTNDGWVRDNDGIPALRLSGNDRVTIPYKMFGKDYRNSGFTVEVEFATSLVMDYDSVIFSCMSGGRGIEMTANKVTLKSEQKELSMQFKEDEHLRITYVVEKRAKNRLIYCYVNGVMSGVVQYPDDDDFSQQIPVNITIGSNDCTMDIYCIRCYETDLSRIQVVDNWIADTQDAELMVERYRHNDVYNEYSAIVIDQLPSDLPYMIIECPELPQKKGDKKNVAVTYIDPLDPTRSFTANVQADVQGTSSQFYERKNYKLKFKNGLDMTQSGAHVASFPIRKGAIGGVEFTMKADVASSEGANNVELARLYNDACPYETPAQEANSAVRQTIDGYPIVIFWRNTDSNTTMFLGKYNFNNDKGDAPIFGFTDGDESWEIKNNGGNRVIWKDDDFTSTTVDKDGKTIPAWTNDFESRYPDDYFDVTQLQKMSSWLKSTDPEQATGDALPSSVTYGETTYTNDTADYRTAKFKAELGNYMEVESVLFYYLFTELFLMVDSRAKNAFPSFIGETIN